MKNNPRSAKSLPGRPSGKSSEDTRRKLLDAALEIFVEQGYSAATTRMVLQRTGLSAPVLYHHFGNKAGLFEAVATDVNDFLESEFIKVAEPHNSLGQKLKAIFIQSAVLRARRPAIVKFILTSPNDLRRQPELRDTATQMNRLLDFLSRLCKEYTLPGEDVAQTTAISHVILQGLAHQAATSSSRKYRKTVVALCGLLDYPPFEIPD